MQLIHRDKFISITNKKEERGGDYEANMTAERSNSGLSGLATQ